MVSLISPFIETRLLQKRNFLEAFTSPNGMDSVGAFVMKFDSTKLSFTELCVAPTVETVSEVLILVISIVI